MANNLRIDFVVFGRAQPMEAAPLRDPTKPPPFLPRQRLVEMIQVPKEEYEDMRQQLVLFRTLSIVAGSLLVVMSMILPMIGR